jgi:PAS domain S-box-containing protein
VDQHAEALFRGVFEAAPDAVVIVDDGGVIVLANPQCATVFGAGPAELVGLAVEELVPMRARARHPGRRTAYDAAANTRPMGLLRLSAVRRDGTEFPAEISLAPIEVHGVHYVSATVRDITARIRDEERFRSLLEAAPDATVIVDADARIVLTNNRVLAVLGYERTDLVGQSLASLAGSPGPEEVLERLGAYFRAPESVPMGYTQEFQVRAKDGRLLPVEVALSPLATVDGPLVTIALRDVTERRRLESESQRLRDDLIATVSHELRTPLTSIIGYAELMEDLGPEDVSEQARKHLRVIGRNARRELQLVDDLLTMAFLDGDRLRMIRTAVDLGEVCRRVVDDHTPRALEREVGLVYAGGEAEPVIGDFDRLIQVVENLVTNSLKFTLPGGRVEVDVAEHGAMGVVEVRDTGIGVSPDEKAFLFDRLYRAPRAIRDQVPGAGLGLPIVRTIVEAHGGWVDLDSEVGVGTIVRVGVPHPL